MTQAHKRSVAKISVKPKAVTKLSEAQRKRIMSILEAHLAKGTARPARKAR